MDLGMKGAALAALGDMAAGFLPLVASLAERNKGVKLGESTLNVFFAVLLRNAIQHGILSRERRGLLRLHVVSCHWFRDIMTESAAYPCSARGPILKCAVSPDLCLHIDISHISLRSGTMYLWHDLLVTCRESPSCNPCCCLCPKGHIPRTLGRGEFRISSILLLPTAAMFAPHHTISN